MAAKKYRVLTKVYCQQCLTNIMMKKGIDTRCGDCPFLKHRVTDLLSFTKFLDREHSDWVYFNCYEYVKGQDKGKWLGSFQNKGKRPVSKNEL